MRVLDLDERSAKAAIFGLNSVGRRPQELEEAWIVQALVREDGLSQQEAAELLGRHKSWVCRRLALLERLCDEAQGELRLGVLSAGLARQLTRLPVGNQAAVLAAARRATLTMTEMQGVIDLVRGATPEQEALLLQEPRAALLQAAGVPGPARDPRLSPAGNRLARQLGMLLDLLGRVENWLRHPGLAELKRDDRRLLAPQFARLARDAPQRRRPGGRAVAVGTAGARFMNEEIRNEIVRRRQGGASMRRIARDLGLARETVQNVVRRWEAERAGGDGRPSRSRRPSQVDPFEETIRQLLQRYPDITIVRVFEELRAGASRAASPSSANGCWSCDRNRGVSRWSASRRRRGSRPRWITAPTTSTSRAKGRRRVHLFSYLLGYSRRQYLHFVEAQDLPTTLREHVRAFEHLGGVAGDLPVRQHEGGGAAARRRGAAVQPEVPGLRHALRLHAVGLPCAAQSNEGQGGAAVLVRRDEPAQRPHLPHAGAPQRGDGLVAGPRRRRARPPRDANAGRSTAMRRNART